MKKISSVFLIIAVLIFNVNIYHVQASTNWFAVLTNAADVFVNTSTPTQQSTLQLINDFLQTNGFASAIANSVSPASDDIIKYFASQIDASQANKTLQENIEAIRECVENGFTGGDSSVTFNNTLHNAIYNTANYYVEESSGQIAYALSLQNSQSSFTSEEISIFSQCITDNPNYYWYRISDTSSVGNNWFIGLNPGDGQIYGVVQKALPSTAQNYVQVAFYHVYYINGILHCERYQATEPGDLIAYGKGRGESSWTNKTSTWNYPWNGVVQGSGAGASTFTCAVYGLEKDLPILSTDFTYNTGYPASLSSSNKEILYFNTESALQTYINTYGVGKQAYYYNNQVWSDFSNHTSGDYTVDNSNVNTVTYGDVISYVNDSHDTNNNYPDNSTVNTWIETTNNNNNSGGGSGDDSGGGSGGSGSDNSGSIFDWLKTLGKALGDLISGVGNFLSEIVAGLVDAITNLLDAITTLITGVLESLTNIFSGLIEFIFAGLPDDIRNVLSLALTVAILISVLKLIRGN